MSDEQTIRAGVQRQLAAGNRTTTVRAQVTLLQIIDTLRTKLEAGEMQAHRQGERIDRAEAALRDVMALHVSERGACGLCSPQEGRAPCSTWLTCEGALP